MRTKHVVPVYKFDIRVALHQDETAPVSQKWCEGRMRDPALDGTESTITSGIVHVLWDGAEQKPNKSQSGLEFKFLVGSARLN